MSWRRFCVLYAALGPESLTCRNYRRAAAEAGADAGAEEAAWVALAAGGTGKGR